MFTQPEQFPTLFFLTSSLPSFFICSLLFLNFHLVFSDLFSQFNSSFSLNSLLRYFSWHFISVPFLSQRFPFSSIKSSFIFSSLSSFSHFLYSSSPIFDVSLSMAPRLHSLLELRRWCFLFSSRCQGTEVMIETN